MTGYDNESSPNLGWIGRRRLKSRRCCNRFSAANNQGPVRPQRFGIRSVLAGSLQVVETYPPDHIFYLEKAGQKALPRKESQRQLRSKSNDKLGASIWSLQERH